MKRSRRCSPRATCFFSTASSGQGRRPSCAGWPGLGLQADEVTSPTFTLIQEYRTPGAGVVLYHADLYRLSPREVDDLGLGELSEDGILAVEWPDRWNDPPASGYRVRIEHRGENLRSITFSRL